MSLFDLMADLLPEGQQTETKAGTPSVNEPCLNSPNVSHQQRHSESSPAQLLATPLQPGDSADQSGGQQACSTGNDRTGQPDLIEKEELPLPSGQVDPMAQSGQLGPPTTAEQDHRPLPAGGQQTASDHGIKAEGPVGTTRAATHETTQSGAYQAGQGAVKAKIYTAVIDGKEITLIDTNTLPSDQFIQGVNKRFGCERVGCVVVSTGQSKG